MTEKEPASETFIFKEKLDDGKYSLYVTLCHACWRRLLSYNQSNASN
jgi:hypothetical protein